MANYQGLNCIMGEITMMASNEKNPIHEQHIACLFNVPINFTFSCPEFGINRIIFLVDTDIIGIIVEMIGNLVHVFRDHPQIEAVGTGLIISLPFV